MKMDRRSSVVPTRDDDLKQAGLYLRKVEEAFKTTNGRRFSKGEMDYFRHHADHCAQLEDQYLSAGETDAAARIGYWAQRLASEITNKMEDAP